MNSISRPAQLQSDQGIVVLTLMTLGGDLPRFVGSGAIWLGPQSLGRSFKNIDDLSDLSLSFTSIQPLSPFRSTAGNQPARALPDHCPTAVVDVPTMTADVAVPLIKFFRV
jgi:hypothetical protein